MLTRLDSTVLSAKINVTNWTELGVPWYLIREMENNGQFRSAVATPYSVEGPLGTSFSAFLTSRFNGILALIAVSIVRISISVETG